MPYAKVRGLNMYYEVHGEGFPLVMIMGLGANVYWWDPFIIDEFSKHFKVVVFDNRGAGRTDKPGVEYTM
ncbi:MAG: alpha/beta fold hydrolase, partial [Candidatus Jordarchaeales archaeon]